MLRALVSALIVLAALSMGASAQEPPDGLHPVRPDALCTTDCHERHAVVFVHGITGNTRDTFKNGDFSWPASFPTELHAPSANGDSIQRLDVYTLQYRSAIVSWEAKNTPEFDDLVDVVFEAMRPIRAKGYQSIGFITHSLGGVVIASYLHELKASLGHPHRSQNSFLVTLGTPRSGSYFASIVAPFVTMIGAGNPLLDVLKKDNLYLRMSDRLGAWTQGKTTRFDCRPLLVYVAYEKDALIAPMSVTSLKIAPPRDAQEFELSHEMIAKPQSLDDDLARFVQRSIVDALNMTEKWNARMAQSPPDHRLCKQIPFVPERRRTPPLMRPEPLGSPDYYLAPVRELDFLR